MNNLYYFYLLYNLKANIKHSRSQCLVLYSRNENKTKKIKSLKNKKI